ncbi:1-acyl-sn-glycerol-3-phosphate acyltransferase [Candidatus Kaiserbacteria bacterium]|nr:1-acyl-sn-glycerol-3-phosphate acyltransferase [Candidatus Kaiserbacteria bacterium]
MLKKDWILVCTQMLAYIVAAIPLRLFYDVKRRFVGDIGKIRKGSLIISNHQSMVDPFLVLACLPLKDFLRLLPIRFPASDVIYKNPRFNPKIFPIMTLLGCFSIGGTVSERTHAIFYIRDLLNKNKTVFLFPEGAISREDNVLNLKQGVDFFIKNTHSVMFVRLEGLNHKVRGVEKTGHYVTFGEVFDPPPAMSVEEMKDYLESLHQHELF